MKGQEMLRSFLRTAVARAACGCGVSAIDKKVISDVESSIASRKVFTAEAAQKWVGEYFSLGFDCKYAKAFQTAALSEHAYGYVCACAAAKAGRPFEFSKVDGDHAFFFCRAEDQVATEKRIDALLKAQEKKMATHAFSVSSFRSECGKVVLYTLDFAPFAAADNGLLKRLETEIKPVYEISSCGDETCVSLALMADRPSYFAALTRLMESVPSATVTKKTAQSFSNGAQVYQCCIKGAKPADVEKAAALMNYVLQAPDNAITQLYSEKLLTESEVMYAHALVIFTYYFAPSPASDEYTDLSRDLAPHPIAMKRLQALRKRLFGQMMTERFITSVLASHPELLKALYTDFEKNTSAESAQKLSELINTTLKNDATAKLIFQTFLTFNKSCVKTNFYKVGKAAVAYRFDPSFIANLEFPRVPFGIFIVVGSHFRGFHVRFTDIARGGIRLIKHREVKEYTDRKRQLFNENFNLAQAQLLKNKDIPEGGSKGTIFVSLRQKDIREVNLRRMFLQYVDSLLDLMLPPKDGVRDNLKQEEILFLGPDENTAGEYPNLGAFHAKARGHKHWKSFTTGKEPNVGGIPHDIYGMTTLSVRACVNKIYEKLNLRGEDLTKIMTGGPDGDLGSNEIKMGMEKTLGIADGSGVVYDPKGLDQEELLRLAKERVMVEKFDTSKLSSEGFLVKLNDENRKLPDGTMVESGKKFRDEFHFTPYARADTFVPCGGKPEAVTLATVHKFVMGMETTGQAMLEGKVGNLAGTGKLRFKYISEGANLFITHDARLALEKVGVVLVKDSSANKGGVSSSSLEVLAGLAMSDEEYSQHMCEKDGALPDFYKRYVEGIVQRVQDNARREFECLWRESRRGKCGGMITLVSDDLSQRIVNMRKYVYESNLFENKQLVRYILKKYVPLPLQEVVPVDVLMQRVPKNYVRSIFSIWIASDYVYTTGLDANEFTFFQYLHPLVKAAEAMH